MLFVWASLVKMLVCFRFVSEKKRGRLKRVQKEKGRKKKRADEKHTAQFFLGLAAVLGEAAQTFTKNTARSTGSTTAPKYAQGVRYLKSALEWMRKKGKRKKVKNKTKQEQ